MNMTFFFYNSKKYLLTQWVKAMEIHIMHLKSENRPTSPWITTNENKPMSLMASSAEQVLVNACTNKCENRMTTDKKWKSATGTKQAFYVGVLFFYFSLSEKILTCHVQKDCLELPYTVTEFWHAMYKRWGSAVLPDKEVISHTEQVLKDGQEASLILLVRRIHLLQYFKAMIGISILNQLRKSLHMHPTLRDFMKPCSESLNQALNKHGR